MAEATLATVLLAVLVYHAWFAYQTAKERRELTREITNLAVSRTPSELRAVRAEAPAFPEPSPFPEGFEYTVGL